MTINNRLNRLRLRRSTRRSQCDVCDEWFPTNETHLVATGEVQQPIAFLCPECFEEYEEDRLSDLSVSQPFGDALSNFVAILKEVKEREDRL